MMEFNYMGKEENGEHRIDVWLDDSYIGELGLSDEQWQRLNELPEMPEMIQVQVNR